MPQIDRFATARCIVRESGSAVRLQQYTSADERQNPRRDCHDEDQYEHRIAKIGREGVMDVVL
ncbi:MAG TPA: hypothetical protein VIH76_15745 [Candidatus Acidoferrales bacterium]